MQVFLKFSSQTLKHATVWTILVIHACWRSRYAWLGASPGLKERMFGDRRAHRAAELDTEGMVACAESAGPGRRLRVPCPRGTYDVYFTFRAER